MRNLGLLVLLALSFASLKAQENVIKVNPFALLGGNDLVSYERALGEHSSGTIGAGYGGYQLGGLKYKNYGASLQYRYYFNEALTGFFGAAALGYSKGSVELDNDNDDIDFNSFGGGLRAGYQWIWDSGFSLDLNAGINYRSFSYEDDENISLKGNGILPSFGLGIGYAF